MNLILYLYRQSARLLALASITGALGGLASAGLVILINRGLANPQQLPSLALAFFGLCAGMLVSKLCSEVSLLHLTQRAIFQMRIDLSRKLLATPLKRLQALGKHRLLVILTEDVHTFTAAFEWVPLLFVNAVVTLACFAYLAWLSWSLLAILGLFLVVGLVAFHLAERKPLGHLEQVRQQKDVLYQHFRSLIEGSKELQLNNARGEAFVERVIRPGANEFRLRFLRGMTGYSLVANLGTLLFYLNLGVLLFVVPFFLPQSAVVLTSFTVTLLYLVRPISDLMIALPSLRQASIALERIRQLDNELNREAQAAASAGCPFAHQEPPRLLLNGVCHRYPGEHEDHPFMLGPVDLTLEPGELVFVVGGNGSGKTTLSMLLLGLYAPESGCVVLNGVEVDDDNREHYRQHFAAVFADFHLFEHLLGEDGPGAQQRNAEATRYIKALGLGHKVSIVDDKFSTVELSTGQRKRLALVSAYLDDKPFYLFDEWAADQDPSFKRVFYMELLPALKARGKTVIVITHDDAYFGQADRVLKVENGRLTQVEAHAAYA
ncbi:cyclic peptide export ABC transporter [Pseudomonas putida]|uniref:cyclic peptide export ABC transporter n=1 Tax=Pseudomonas putida TaxID=303 RepID=UPI0018AA8A28|nr:cyclic peptide export ABC transporter [Pseudomonas putida]MBF8669936.1 cyclic peptide export ABC transporter [Pseudomonas putida]MBF8712664.1 cyclic peptide export ABC transporter [Pseudomonas putida]